MEQQRSARERIMTAFVELLENRPVSEEDAATLARVMGVLDAHFKTYCSFYDPKSFAGFLTRLPPFFANLLVHPTDYDRISVAVLTKAAGVNRTTFYKLFPNVSALYAACCEYLTQAFLEIPLPKEKTPETMFLYGEKLWRLTELNSARMFTLSHRVNRKQQPYLIAQRLKQKMDDSLTAEARASFRTRANLALFPEMFSSWLSVILIEQIAPDLYPDRNLPVYRPNRSLIENIALQFSERYGGSTAFYHALGGASLKLLSEKRYETVHVSELCQTAGYPRSSFYLFFSDMTDYVMKVFENAVLVCLSAFLYFLDHPEALTNEALRVFRGEVADFAMEGIRAIFRNGSITYIFSMLYVYLIRTFESRIPSDKADFNRNRSRVAYYITFAMLVFSMYFIGDMPAHELSVRRQELAHIRKMIGLD